jgi:1,4-dihydroxy-6-naphthoate synthase
VAVPGKLTTAYLALQLYQPDCTAVVVPFDEIEDAVHRGDVEVGLLIHEGQLTYVDAGLNLWADLGAWWLEDTGLPLPLGGNAVRRDLGPEVIAQIARDLRASIVYALEHREPALAHAKQYNRGIGDERTDTFVGMYVDQWTVDYGPRGRQAVQVLLDRAHTAGIIPERVPVEFVG